MNEKSTALSSYFKKFYEEINSADNGEPYEHKISNTEDMQKINDYWDNDALEDVEDEGSVHQVGKGMTVSARPRAGQGHQVTEYQCLTSYKTEDYNSQGYIQEGALRRKDRLGYVQTEKSDFDVRTWREVEAENASDR